MGQDTTVACYYFPNYHIDQRNVALHGAGWSEWEVVKHAPVMFKGHEQPKVPAWGYTDEADPTVMAQKIAAAADHGIDVFIFDWYWYDDGPYLQRGLEEGFLHAPNNERIAFALMWANHDWLDIHPQRAPGQPPLLYQGRVTPETFDALTDHVINTYFTHPSYWKVGGCPYFSIYELSTFLESFGSFEASREALARFRVKTKHAGFPDLHLNAVFFGHPALPGEKELPEPEDLIPALGFDSVTSYVWIHHVPLDSPQTPYERVKRRYLSFAERAMQRFTIPYYPNVTVGWDNNPRFYRTGYRPIIAGNTPEAFRSALEEVGRLLAHRSPQQRILTLNAWNEWTEGSYLEPDTRYGMGYLKAIREVFGVRQEEDK